MKLHIASILAFASSVLATLSINNPVGNTEWANGVPATISWISTDGSPLTGTVTVQLMEGTDQNNLGLVATIASNIQASVGQVQFTPPSNLAGSKFYAVRVTSSVDGPHYSHSFQAGDASISASASSAITVSASQDSSSDAESSSEAPSSKASSSADESSSDEKSSSVESSSEKPSSDEPSSEESSADESSSEEESLDDDSSDESSESSEDSSEEDSDTSGAAGLTTTLGLFGLSVIAAMV
ncbi:hypothetical protein LPJ70_003231 [Coemansia sp. RSA 2708]|nr:hypothetical protein LPJ70_003231 [Coemansia sp. RSA 2708]KAJ2361690.1 hypothetical protein H4S01_005156 [Coemansia sp. RSA 2610]